MLQLERESRQSITILNLDLEQAYDRVSHRFLFQKLEWMGVPPTFVGWIRTFYMEVSSEVQINGFLSTWIVVELGVWQGCPISPILFVSAIEPLAQRLRQDLRINRIHIPGRSN
ncbi:hypothetical protein Y1Q_0007944 [Alligator mississippiensis]|uniref:Reverse transcriptase domain-containing protein n=1 Tax=Alligator mississippiensis TaxID=8496 RepID=A0A151NEW9_ALLMI|nr:hypothetical protein Y1Q_0007944 [Alligator mississippiensis]